VSLTVVITHTRVFFILLLVYFVLKYENRSVFSRFPVYCFLIKRVIVRGCPTFSSECEMLDFLGGDIFDYGLSGCDEV
jgi:hypothetical protein